MRVIPAMLLACLGWVAAAVVLAAPALPIRFQHLTSRDGLSQSTVMASVQDSQGFMWFATENGLNRYDGRQLRRYQRGGADAGSLSSDFIWSVEEDSSGNLWLATIGGGVAKWDRKTDRFTHYRHDPSRRGSIASDSIRTLLIDSSGAIWAGSERDGISVLDAEGGEFRVLLPRSSKNPKASSIYALYEEAGGVVWIGTDDGLYRAEGRGSAMTLARENRLVEGRAVAVRAITNDAQGALLIGTMDQGLLRFDPRAGAVQQWRHDPAEERSLSDDDVRAVLVDSAGRVWVATTDGLNLLHPESGDFTRYRHDPTDESSLRDSYIMSLHEDRGGVIWVGTRAGGVSRWHPDSWLLGHRRPTQLRNAIVTSFADDGVGTAWIGTAGQGLIEFDLRTGAAQRTASLGDDRIMALLRDRDGQLWVGTMTEGLVVLDARGRIVRRFKHDASDASSLGADGIMSLFEDRKGSIWVGTFGGGVARYDRLRRAFDRVPQSGESAALLRNERITSFSEDRGGNIWVGTAGRGLHVLDPRRNTVIRFMHQDGDSSSIQDNTIYSLHVDRDGDLWIGTAGGGLSRLRRPDLAKLDGVRFETISAANGIPSNVVYGIQSDAAGHLWLSTNLGLSSIDTRTGKISNIHEGHGLQGEEFNFGAHYRSPSGLLYFGGNNGFNAFDPAKLRHDRPPPPVVITAIETLNQPAVTPQTHWTLGSLRLSHEDAVVSFEFAALDFLDPLRNRYRYQLQGFDDSWITSDSARRVSYTNLAPGTYLFRVAAAGADGVWNEQGASLQLTMEPAPWATPIAKTLYAVLILGGMLLLLQQHRTRLRRETAYSMRLARQVEERTRELSARNEELQLLSRAKDDFVARMSHELRTPMNGVVGLTELLLDSPLDARQARCAVGIRRSAGALVAIVDDILDLAKVESGHVELSSAPAEPDEIVESVADTFAARALDRGIELVVDVPAVPMGFRSLDSLRLRQVLTNLLGNAVKFTAQGHVTIGVREEHRSDGLSLLRFWVHDSGPGIREDALERIFEPFVQESQDTAAQFGGTGLGLTISKQLVNAMGGEISVASTLNVGTRFEFTVSANVTLPERGANERAGGETLLRDKRVLVAVRSPALGIVLQRHLTSLGASVIQQHAANPSSPVACPIDLVVGDTDVVGASGWGVATFGSESSRQISTILLATLHEVGGGIGAAAKPGCPPTIKVNKPVRVSDLHSALRELLVPAQPGLAAGDPAGVQRGPSDRYAGLALVVEDHEINRVVARGMLESLGYEVVEAQDGIEAVEMISHAPVALVLMDCQMERLDGYAATQRIRSMPSLKSDRLVIIGLTADATPRARKRCLDVGMDSVLTKPLSRDALISVLKSTGVPNAAVDQRSAVLDASACDPTPLNALAQTPGGANAVSKVLRLYQSQSIASLDRIGQALAGADVAGAERAVHAWKSYNGNVGARGLERLCDDMSRALRDGQLGVAEGILLQMRSAHEQVVATFAERSEPRQVTA